MGHDMARRIHVGGGVSFRDDIGATNELRRE